LNGFPEAEITSRVSKSPHDPDACNLLVVADKYQTGYDEPLLCTLYLNKTLREPVAAMQTVSRINRIRRQNDKHKTSVIDFRGNETHVRAAFEKYGVTSTLPSVPLQPKLADLAKTIYTHRAITRDNVTDYAKRATGGDSAEAAREIIDGCRHRAETRRRRTLNGEQRHATFIADCHKFMHEYLFVSQLGRVHDPDMHALHDLLGMFLATYKPEVATPTDASWLENITIEVAAAGENLLPEQPTTPAISRGSRGRHRNRDNERKPVAVDDLVENHNRRLNQYFATFEDTVALPDGLVDLIVEEIKGNDKIERYALLHPEHEFVIAATRDIAHQQILKVLIENEPQDTKNYLLQPREMFAQNQEFREQVIDLFLKVAHQLITTSHDLDAETR
jgi:type I restriction enzyme R subunit